MWSKQECIPVSLSSKDRTWPPLTLALAADPPSFYKRSTDTAAIGEEILAAIPVPTVHEADDSGVTGFSFHPERKAINRERVSVQRAAGLIGQRPQYGHHDSEDVA